MGVPPAKKRSRRGSDPDVDGILPDVAEWPWPVKKADTRFSRLASAPDNWAVTRPFCSTRTREHSWNSWSSELYHTTSFPAVAASRSTR